MQKPLLLALAAIAVLGIGVWVVLGPKTPPPEPPAVAPPAPPLELTRTPTSSTPRRSLIPSAMPTTSLAPKPDAPPSPLTPLAPEVDPLAEIDFREASDGDRQRLNVPKKFGRGVVLTRVGPDSPAALSALRTDDVIVRAHRTDVNTRDDLARAVHDREHTLLVISRGGNFFEVVLHKPKEH